MGEGMGRAVCEAPTIAEARIYRDVQREFAQAIVHGSPDDPAHWRGGQPIHAHLFYDRMTALGVKRDYWDGEEWRRGSRYSSIVCANQNLPWRLL